MPPRGDALPVVFRTALELAPAPVIENYRAILASWTAPDASQEEVSTSMPDYVPA
jgi:hypothetical protein